MARLLLFAVPLLVSVTLCAYVAGVRDGRRTRMDEFGVTDRTARLQRRAAAIFRGLVQEPTQADDLDAVSFLAPHSREQITTWLEHFDRDTRRVKKGRS